MNCSHRFLLMVIIQVLLSALLLKEGNGQNQSLTDIDETVPFLYNGKTIEFPSIGVRLNVVEVKYETPFLVASDPEGCLPKIFLKLFFGEKMSQKLYSSYYDPTWFLNNVTFFDCSSAKYLNNLHLPSEQNVSVCPIFAVDSNEILPDWDLIFCTKIVELASPIPAQLLSENKLYLPYQPPVVEKHKTRRIVRVVISTSGSIALVLMFIACFGIYRYFKQKGDDQARLEKFLEDYDALQPTRFSYADIKRITNHFKDKLGEGAHGTVFKGKLSTDIQVAVKVLNNSDNDIKGFINEVGTMGKIHHINVVRLLGFCADGFHRALVYEFFPNGSLQKLISSPDNKENFLGWSKLQEIALSIAKGIEYLHQGCDYRILHFDINPRNVLLDQNLSPKISDFGLAKLCPKNRSTVSMTTARGTLGYIAPEVFSQNFGNVSYKSDIYSYGILLLEMVGGRRNVNTNQQTFQVLYPSWIHNLIEGGDVSIYIEDEFEIRTAKKLATVGLSCIQWYPISRPSMKTVIQMLEGEVDELKVPPTLFDFTTSTNTSIIVPARHLNSDLDVIHELE